jgi:NAD(P)-dependent dehydrogenase (short-subunit alcohol dehydrogenase family)
VSDFLEKRVFIAGKANEVLLSCAKRFLADGASLCVVTLDTVSEPAETPADAGAIASLSFDIDPMNAESWKAAFARCIEELGGLDVIVSICGQAQSSPIEELSLGEFSSAHRAIVVPAFLAQNLGILAMRSVGSRGALVHVLPSAARMARDGQAAVSVASTGIRYSAKAAALECAREQDGIVVNTVIAGDVPANDVAESVFFYATDGAEYMTGTDMPIDDGLIST